MLRPAALPLALAAAGFPLLVGYLLLPVTDAVWAPLMAVAAGACTWLVGWPGGLVALILGVAGRVIWLAPTLWARPGWAGGWLAASLVAMGLAQLARHARAERAQARRVQRDQAERAHRAMLARRAAFLAHASEVLASSPDYETTLPAVANLAVPQIADLCVVDLVQDDGSFTPLAVAHVDPDKVQLVRELRGMYPLDGDAPYGPPRVLRTGRSVVYTDLAAVIREGGIAPSDLRVATALGIRSSMAAPLVVGGRRFGVISLATTDSGRRYLESDLFFAEDLARRAAVAIDAARP